jgi:hypothetical protein
MHEPTETTRIVAIVPSQDSAFYVAGEDLIQTSLDHEGYAYVAGPETPHPLDGGRAVDWDRAFSSEAQAEAVRRADRVLRSLPADVTAPGSDPIPLSRRDVSDLLAALAAARHNASEVYSAAAEAARQSGQKSAARERECIAARLRESADRLVQSAGAALSAEDPLAVLAGVMPLVRERDGNGRSERR